MTLQDSLHSGSIVQQPTSRAEIQELLRLAARSIGDANAAGLSPEGRFKLAYEAALQLSTIALRCAGYRTKGEGHHWTLFNALPDVMGPEVGELADYFQVCRGKRSAATYHASSAVSRDEADELFREVEEFDITIRRWTKDNYPQYA